MFCVVIVYREFNTVIDIKLTDWANHALPKKSVEVNNTKG